MNEQVIVVTGASSGIGLATAVAAASKGASVVMAARSAEVLESVATNAGNYLSQAPKLPTPMIAPEKVATAILDNAVDPKDFDRIGAMAVIDSVIAKVLPSLSTAMSKMQVGRPQRNEPALKAGKSLRRGTFRTNQRTR